MTVVIAVVILFICLSVTLNGSVYRKCAVHHMIVSSFMRPNLARSQTEVDGKKNDHVTCDG